MFSNGKTPLQVAIALNIKQSEVTKYYKEYWILKRLHKLYSAYTELGDEGLGAFLKLYRLMKEKGMSIEQVVAAVCSAIHKLPYMEDLYKQVIHEVDNLQCLSQELRNHIEALKYKLSILDKTALSAEQERKRIEQQLQELIDKKDRLEKWITNVLNGEGYTKLNQSAKESVKAVLSDNKILISISFAALIQTIKNDPQMTNLIHKIATTNDGQQHKDDNNNNAIKYVEVNKNSLSDLAEKHYENLVEVLTNDSISYATTSSNPTSSLHYSSSKFPNLLKQIDNTE